MGRQWGRRYPPLATVAMALALAVFALPSALNQPQANPSQLTEYAPVPGNATQANAGGNFAGLGLGAGGAGEGAGSFGDGLGLLPPPSLPNQPHSRFNCVGSPPRQTEDPLSPPCVPAYSGDNGGSTYTGVTRTEIRILFHFDGGGADIDNQTVPSDGLHDLDQPPQAGEYPDLTFLRNWMKYFNSRYQTYGRRVHFYAFFNNVLAVGTTPPIETETTDAAANYSEVHPFGVMTVRSAAGYSAAYLDEMNRRGVVSFGSTAGLRDAAAYSRFPGLSWEFRPAVDQVARQFSSFLCSEVAPYGVSFSGDATMTGKQRVYGLLYGNNPSVPAQTKMAQQVQQQVASCGITFRLTQGLRYTDAIYTEDPGTDSQAAIANFRSQGVTTIVWPGGWNVHPGQDATAIGYLPEWVAADDWNNFDTQTIGNASDQTQWAHLWLVTPETMNNDRGLPAESRCLDAYTSVDPTITQNPGHLAFACRFYDSLLMTFTGIQVGGPHLNPQSLDQGFHAIPAHASSSALTPACYFDPGDYTCEKDAVAEFWDTSAVNTGGGQGSGGCYRMAENGTRHRAGEWPAIDVARLRQLGDVCNLYSGRN